MLHAALVTPAILASAMSTQSKKNVSVGAPKLRRQLRKVQYELINVGYFSQNHAKDQV